MQQANDKAQLDSAITAQQSVHVSLAFLHSSTRASQISSFARASLLRMSQEYFALVPNI
jgi:hypothetical protein